MTNNQPYIVFLVEDNEFYEKGLEKFLTDHLKYNVVLKHFLTGEECLANMHLKPNIIVLDYLLNSKNQHALNGIEILKKVKVKNPETAVIMLSGQDNTEVATETMRFGGFDYVVKNERAHLRVQNAINNIIHSQIIALELKQYKKAKMVVLISIAIIFAVTIFLYYYPQLVSK